MAAHKKWRQMSPLGTTEMVTTSTTPTPSSSSASTSTGQQIWTVMVSASADETKMVLQLCYHLEVTFPSRMKMIPQKMRNLCPLILL